jgi:glycosyltransferase involved in cell wall biosynthesis
LALDGGVERFVQERRRELNTMGLHVLVLKPAAPGDLTRCELLVEALNLSNLHYEIPGEIQALVKTLGRLRLRAVEIQHFLHLDSRVIDAVRHLKVPYTVFIHDYSWFCPRITLMDGRRQYCGEPSIAACEACIRKNGSELGEKLSVRRLRERSARWLAGASRVSAPSHDTARRLQRHFAGLAVDVRPHRSVVEEITWERRTNDRSVTVALIGGIGEHKGYYILLKCARDAQVRRLPMEFVVIGHTQNDAPLLATGKVFITGRYADAEVARLLQREKPDIAWFPSVWPETWCYTLDYAFAAHMTVLAYDLGAIAERLNSRDACELVPLSTKPSSLNDRLLQTARRARDNARNQVIRDKIF